jgi:nicotinamide-nucleotide amidase
MTIPQVQLLLTGNELMSGDVIDSNSAMIAQQLKDIGIEVQRRVTIADNLQNLVTEIQSLSKQCDILIVNGGLGPTVDDMTAQALAVAANKKIIRHPDAIKHLKKWCKQRNNHLSEENKKQADLPEDCEIIANKIGSAVGFKLTLEHCDIFCTPGVPSELQQMMANEIIPQLAKRIPQHLQTKVKKIHVFGLGESTIQRLINENLPAWPSDIELGFRAAIPMIEIKLTSRSTVAEKKIPHWVSKLQQLLGDHIVGEGNITLNQVVVNLLAQHKKLFTCAESCTGGLIATKITEISGASQVFEAGFVTYSNAMKTKMLDVSSALLQQHGAVSEPTVKAMLAGALSISNADYGVAVSGIAGPHGDTTKKPVGMVWIAWGGRKNSQSVCLYIPYARHYFQHYVTAICLDLIRRLLINSQEKPLYIIERQFNHDHKKDE